MKAPALLLALLAGLVLRSVPALADPAPAPPAPAIMAEVDLKSGRALHHVKVIADEPDSIVVRADEGLIKVAKADLPPELAARYPPKAPPAQYVAAPAFSLTQAPSPQTPPPRPVKPVRKSKPAEFPATYKGCTLVSFTPKPFQSAQGAAEIHIHNDTDAPVELFPADLAAQSADGRLQRGRFLAALPDNGAAVIKRHDVVPANGDLTELVIFSTEAIDLAGVHWSGR